MMEVTTNAKTWTYLAVLLAMASTAQKYEIQNHKSKGEYCWIFGDPLKLTEH